VQDFFDAPTISETAARLEPQLRLEA
jgi:hypothetical protein